MHAAQSLNQDSIIPHILLGAESALQKAMVAIAAISIVFGLMEHEVGCGSDVAAVARLGCRAAGDALKDCRDHASLGDIIGVIDCLACAVSAHRTAKNLFLAIVELGDADVAEKAQLGVALAESVLNDLGA